MEMITAALEASGITQNELAQTLKVFPQQVNQWVKGRRPVPAKHCIAIEQMSGGKVTRYDLRPDVFGAAPDDLKDAA